MSYTILPYTKTQARKMGVTVKPSTRSGKKLDVFRDGEYIDSVGALGYSDYPHYIKEKGKAYANERRRLYHARHIGRSQGERLAKGLLW